MKKYMMIMMKIKKMRVVLTVMIVMIGLASVAQPPDRPSKEKMEQLKVAFLSEELDLSVEEGQKFWPIYNEFTSKRDVLDEQKKKDKKQMKKLENPSDTDVENALNAMTQSRIDEIMLEDQFIKDCLPVLGPEKTLKLIKSERKFKRAMIDKMKGDRPPPPRH